MSINIRLIIALILVTLLFLAVIFTVFVVYGLAGAFGQQNKSDNFLLQASPIILGIIFVMHTLWSARSHINQFENK